MWFIRNLTRHVNVVGEQEKLNSDLNTYKIQSHPLYSSTILLY